MRFEVLGALRVLSDAEPIDLGTLKRRTLVAMLLRSAGAAVTSNELLDAMWGRPRLDSSRNTMHWHIHQLRKSLGDPGRVVRRDGGYALVTEVAEVDARQFERWYREGVAASAAGDATEAVRLLARAEGLWRGDAYAELRQPPALAAEAERLFELRLAGIEKRCSAELQQGRHAALVPELSGLVTRYPLREGLRGRLMLALYRSGRQTEALQTYRAGRELGITEFGVEPGVELVKLERAILRQSPTLDLPRRPAAPVVVAASPTSAGEVRRPIPAELPADLNAFTGRSAERARLQAMLLSRSGPAVVAVLSGPGGVGKSALAIHTGHKLAQQFPDGQLYVDLHGATPEVRPLEPGAVLVRFLRSLGVEGGEASATTDELAGRFRSHTYRKRLLIIADNAADAAQVRPLLPNGTGCAMVITSRRRLLTLPNARVEQLDVLDEADARLLLAASIGPERVSAESSAAARLVGLCGGLPLAIALAAAKLAGAPGQTIAGYAELLADSDQRLAGLEVEDQAVRAAFEVSYRALTAGGGDSPAARMFGLFGLTEGGDIDLAAAAALADLTVPEARRVLDELIDAALIDGHQPGRYRGHDLLRLYAREQAMASIDVAQRERAVRRLHHCYLATARRAVRMLHPQRRWRTELGEQDLVHDGMPLDDGEAAAHWFDVELDNLMAATEQAAGLTEGGEPTAIALSATLNSRVSMIGRPSEQDRLTRTAVSAAQCAGTEEDLAFAWYDHAETLQHNGDDPGALEAMNHALAAAERGGDELLRGRVLKSLAYILDKLGRFDEAINHARHGLAIHRAHGNPLGEAHGLLVLGVIHRKAGRHGESIRAHREAVEIIAEHGNDSARVLIAGQLGEAYLAAGRPSEAVEAFGRALQLCGAARLLNSRFEALQLWGLAEAKHALAQPQQARKHWDDAAAVLAELGLIDAAQRAEIAQSAPPVRPKILRS